MKIKGYNIHKGSNILTHQTNIIKYYNLLFFLDEIKLKEEHILLNLYIINKKDEFSHILRHLLHTRPKYLQ